MWGAGDRGGGVGSEGVSVRGGDRCPCLLMVQRVTKRGGDVWH